MIHYCIGGGSVSKELESRNQTMFNLYAQGKSKQAIADRFGISRQAVTKIIARYERDGVTTDDESRAMHRAQMEGIMTEALAILYAPAPPDFDVRGNMLVDENGEPVRNYDDKIKAGVLAIKVSSEIRRMDAIDKPRRKQLPESEAVKQMEEWLASLPKGEVIPPGE